MTNAEVAIILQMFETNWSGMFEPTPKTVGLWSKAIGGFSFDDAYVTAQRIVETKEKPPPVSVFLNEHRNLHRGSGSPESPTEDCPHCDHGFIAGAPVEQKYARPGGGVDIVMVDTVKPCEHCRPAQYAAWRERTEKANRHRERVAMKDRTYVANPKEGLAMAREALDKSKPWQPFRSPPEPEEEF